MPDSAKGAVTKGPTGELHNGNTSKNGGDGEQNKKENDGAVRINERLHRELDSVGNDKSRGSNGSKNTSIPTIGVKLNPNAIMYIMQIQLKQY